ncbi:MAG: Gx transporter family protein [Lachnospiraceae bacterium]|nr:Gx transporter family protein [Lachnospiraceae bacterium]MCI1328864.1 Gx transporter family protein [Lachnospiraceae bacterium]
MEIKRNQGKKRTVSERPMTPAAKAAYIAILIALSLILSYVEALIPLNFGVPGIKLGLANLVVLIGLFLLRPGEVLAISTARIFLAGFLFGNAASIIYSLAGGLASFAVMLLLIRFSHLSIMGVSIAGGVSHNVGQIIVAALAVENIKILYYLPALLIAGVLTGLLIGVIGGRVLPVVRRIVRRR